MSSKDFIKKTLGVSLRLLNKYSNYNLMDGLTIFIFHEVSNQPSEFAKEYDLAISLDSFEKQIKWIQLNYDILHPSDIINKKIISPQSAIITFDDGFLGAFNSGLKILKDLNIPSIFFLNMRAMVEKEPILSATACYIETYVPKFEQFAKKYKVDKPYHLSISPDTLNLFEKEYGVIDRKSVLEYQGAFADESILKKWDNSELVVFGNHLYDHWNISALNSDEIREQYIKNDTFLSNLNNNIKFFAFPNGCLGKCFTDKDVEFIKKMGALKVFSATGDLNSNASDFLLHRISLNEKDVDEDYIWYKLGKSIINSFF